MVSLSALLGLTAGILLILVRPLAVGFYNVTDETKQLAMQMMAVMACFILFQAPCSTTVVGIMRGGGDTRFSLFADVFCLWVIALPLGFLTGIVLQLHPVLVFTALRLTDEVGKSLLCFWRLRSGRYIRDVTVR